MSESQVKWIELVEAYDEAAESRDPEEVKIPTQNEENEEAGSENESEPEEPEDANGVEDIEEDETQEHVPKHCADLYRSLKPSLDVLDAKTKNAIHKIVVDRLVNG